MAERKQVSFTSDVKEGAEISAALTGDATIAASTTVGAAPRRTSSAKQPPKSSFPPDALSLERRARIESVLGRKIPTLPVRGATPAQLAEAREMSDMLKAEFGFRTPDRGLEDVSDGSINWREGKKPDYTVADLQYFLGKSKNHEKGSLEDTVENMVKTWEMEATHKLFEQWTTVDHASYTVQANGGKVWTATESSWIGNYNWLLSTCDKTLYDNEAETFESSHGKFRYAFPEGFPWEVLEVLSPPPTVFFSWRHWANFSGDYKGHHGNGQNITMTGFGLITLNDAMKITDLKIFYNPDPFLEVLKGELQPSALNDIGAAYGEPIASRPRDINEIAKEEEGKVEEVSGDGGGGAGRGKCPFLHSKMEKHDMKPSGSGGGAGRGRCPFGMHSCGEKEGKKPNGS